MIKGHEKRRERAKEIIQYLNQLQGDFSKFREDFALGGKYLGHAQSTYQSAEKRLDQFTQRLVAADAEPRETLQVKSDGREWGKG
jgi:DNA anti-recombination protein RmuC